MNLFVESKSNVQKKECEIWAIGGGKGGTGKSFVTSCIGSYLTSTGNRVVLIDADLGGANLHTFFGIKRPKNTLTDFFENKMPLNNLVVGTSLNGMGLITGDLHSLDSDSIKYAQKLKLFRQVKSLDTDYILIDLGAGSHNNTIDTFLLADKMVVVILPEITSIENMYHFIKNVLFRKLKMSLAASGLRDIVQDTWKNRNAHNIKNLKELIDYLKGVSVSIRDILNRELSHFKVYLILNQVRTSQEIAIGTSVKSICMKYFGFHTHYVGYVEQDDCISNAINKRQPFMKNYPASRCAKEIQKISDNLINGRQIKVSRA